MSEQELIQNYLKMRMQIIFSQIAPTALLAFAVFATPTIATYNDPLRFSFVFILLASGILGALVQFTSSREMVLLATDLAELENPSRTATGIAKWAQLYWIPMFVTPAIFLVIFISLIAGLID
jgi:hypothetical protein